MRNASSETSVMPGSDSAKLVAQRAVDERDAARTWKPLRRTSRRRSLRRRGTCSTRPARPTTGPDASVPTGGNVTRAARLGESSTIPVSATVRWCLQESRRPDDERDGDVRRERPLRAAARLDREELALHDDVTDPRHAHRQRRCRRVRRRLERKPIAIVRRQHRIEATAEHAGTAITPERAVACRHLGTKPERTRARSRRVRSADRE